MRHIRVIKFKLPLSGEGQAAAPITEPHVECGCSDDAVQEGERKKRVHRRVSVSIHACTRVCVCVYVRMRVHSDNGSSHSY